MTSRYYPVLLGILALTIALAACGAPSTPAGATTTCSFVGTSTSMTLDGERLIFACPKEGSADVGLVGNITAGAGGWQMAKKVYTKSGNTYQTVSTTPVIITSILLADSTQCEFAGTGATITLRGKRVNFTCPNAGNDSVALVGDIQVVAQGWTIEKDTYAKTDSGFSVKSSALVPIRSVTVAPVSGTTK